MGWGVYKQPDGLYAVWSTIVTDFIWMDCSRDEVEEAIREKYGSTMGRPAIDRMFAMADGTQERPRINGTVESFATRMAQRDDQHGLRNEHDGPASGQDRGTLDWLQRMRAVLQEGADNA